MYSKKKHHQKLACPRDNPCDMVLHSRFGKTFGISNESLGLIYFFIVSFLLYIIISTSFAYSTVFMYLLFFLLILGGLFSLYLIALQAFVIRAWCAWCLGVALINLILIISLSNLPFTSIVPILVFQKTWWVIIHNIGFVLGLGAATITDVLFFQFLKDNTISQEEKGTMDMLTNVIWVGLVILVVSGVALYLPEQVKHAVSSKFLLKMIVVAVIIVNGVLLNMFIAPYLRRLSFEGTVPAKRFRRFAFALGGVSIVSWYSAFLLGSLRSIPIVFSKALTWYGILLLVVIIGSQVAERYITKKHSIFKVGGAID
jgi:uncharacterized membrane protein